MRTVRASSLRLGPNCSTIKERYWIELKHIIFYNLAAIEIVRYLNMYCAVICRFLCVRALHSKGRRYLDLYTKENRSIKKKRITFDACHSLFWTSVVKALKCALKRLSLSWNFLGSTWRFLHDVFLYHLRVLVYYGAVD